MGKRIHDTTSDLFLNTIKTAREAGALDALDAIVDCEMPTAALLTGDDIELTKYEFDTAFSVNIGASEGICIVAYSSAKQAGQSMQRPFGGLRGHVPNRGACPGF